MSELFSVLRSLNFVLMDRMDLIISSAAVTTRRVAVESHATVLLTIDVCAVPRTLVCAKEMELRLDIEEG